MKYANVVPILEAIEKKARYSTTSREEGVGIQKALGWIIEYTKLERCNTCNKYFVKLNMHKNRHLKFI